MWNHYGHNVPWVDGVANTSLKSLIEFWQHLKSMLFIAFACISSDVVLAIGQGQGSFLHVTFRWKFQSQGCQRFLWNEDILPYMENMTIWIFELPYSNLDLVKILKKWSNFRQIWQNFKKYIKYRKCRDHFFDNIIVHNLANFQLSISFWTWVTSIFVKYQKIAILRFWPFFHQNWSKFSRL